MILYIIILTILLWYLINLYFFYVKTDFVIGQDYQMVVSPDEEHTNYPIVYFDFKNNIKDIYEIIINKTKKNLTKRNHPLRLSINNNQSKFEYLNSTSQEIIDYTFCKIKDKNELSEEEIINQTSENPNKVKFFIHDKGYIVSFSHLFYDGINAFKVSQDYCDNYDKISLPFFTYIPIYFEYLLIKSGMKYLFNPIHKNLSYDSKLSRNVHYEVDLNQFKKLKNKMNKKVNFSFLLISLQLYSIFNAADNNLNKLTIGIVMAFSNKTRRNNFTALPVVINKPESDLDIMSYIKNILNQIETQYHENNHYITSFYTFTNIYDLNVKVNSFIDFLVSGFPMCKNNNFCIDSVELESTKTIFRNTSMPIYMYHMSDLNKIYISYNIKTNEIDTKKVKDYSEKVNHFLTNI